MNYIAIIILATIAVDLILHLLSDYLNVKSADREVPEKLSNLYEADKYKESQRYLKVRTGYGLFVSIFNLVLFLLFWFFQGFPWLDNLVRSWAYGPVVSGLIYIGLLSLAKLILSIPFKIYSTFVIEERFGFNKVTPKIFIMDLIKGIILTIILGGAILTLVLGVFQYTGPNSWLYCWGAVVAYMFIVQYIMPTWIMPLFNKFTPLEDGELKEAVVNYAKSIDFSLKNIFVMDGSRRSSKSNAFFTGFGKNKRIVLFDTLIENHTVKELLAVLAHEMGHFKKKHILKGIFTGILQLGFMLYILSLFISHQGLFSAFYMDKVSVYAGLIFFSMLYSPVDFLLSIISQLFSRKNEYEADRFAVETTGDNKSIGDALKKLSVDNLSNLTPHPLYVFLNYSHPPLLQRLEAIEKIKV